MKRFSNYDEIQVNDFQERIDAGPHYCKIIDVKLETINSKNGPFDQLIFNIDTTEKDSQPNFYKKRFQKDAESDAMSAKWKGIYKLSVPKDDNSEEDERRKKAFKTFITCIEKSNNGYDWEKADWDEKTLVGKNFVGVFGIEEFENDQGIVVNFTRCRFIRSTDCDFEKVTMPKVKLVSGDYMDYEEWLKGKEEQREKEKELEKMTNGDFAVTESDDDLPF